MTMTITGITPSRWIGRGTLDSNARAHEGYAFVSIPDDKAAERVIERLVLRSTDEDGLDRRTLRDLNADAWGVDDA